MEHIVNGKWLVTPSHLSNNKIILIGKDVCTYLNINFRHSRNGRYFYMKLLAKFYPDKIITHDFDNINLHKIKC